MASTGAQKVAGQIKTIVATLVQRDINDPRLGFVTITEVRLSKDWHQAEIFYTVLGGEEQWASSAAALEKAKGQIRTHVAQKLKMRFTPELIFIADAMPESSSHLEDLIRQARDADANLSAQAAGAHFAGEANPYKVTDDDQ
jgi:ribosome-binding factor A